MTTAVNHNKFNKKVFLFNNSTMSTKNISIIYKGSHKKIELKFKVYKQGQIPIERQTN